MKQCMGGSEQDGITYLLFSHLQLIALPPISQILYSSVILYILKKGNIRANYKISGNFWRNVDANIKILFTLISVE